ncbi:MAG: condensation domain-containing protein [Cyanobacteria bacterium J06592_8]
MKALEQFFSDLQSLNVQLWIEDDRLKYKAPKGSLTPQLKQELKERKLEVIDFLRQFNQVKKFSLPSIEPIESNQNKFPLSQAQKRLWHLARLAPTAAVYNIPYTLKLVGNLNLSALKATLSKIQQRHNILRTCFPVIEGQPVQFVEAEGTLPFKIIDASDRDLEELITEEIQAPFNLEKEYLWRSRLILCSETEYRLIFTFHHLIWDGWSWKVFLNELTTLYESFATGKIQTLPNLPIQYSDFSTWQQQQFSEQNLAESLNYWQQKLDESVVSLKLPTDRKNAISYQGARHRFTLSQSLTQALKRLSEEEELTLFMTLLASFNALLYGYSGQQDLVVCSPVACRNLVEIEPLIGYFNNLVVLRTELGGDPEFTEILQRVQQVANKAFNHQNLPFERVAELPHLVRVPLTTAMFALQTSVPSISLPELTVEVLECHNGTSNFDLSLSLEDDTEGLKGLIEYKTDLFEPDAIAQMVEHFQVLLESIVTNREQTLSALRLPPQFVQPTLDLSLKREYIAPRDEIEIQLTQIWQQLFGLEQIGIHDNFLELGGHSLLAARLCAVIETTFDQHLPLAGIFQAPTIAQLASILRDEKSTELSETLIPIQPHGTQIPIFAIHVLGKSCSFYRPMAQYLGLDQPIYGLRTLSSTIGEQASVEEIAGIYVKELQKFYPQGPYLLSGVSFGGLVAYEMAQQLTAQGQQVAMLVMFDTYSPGTSLKQLYKRLGRHAEILGDNLRKDGLNYVGKRVMGRLQKNQRNIQLMLHKSQATESQMPEDLREQQMIAAGWKRARDYKAQAYPGKIIFFRPLEWIEALDTWEKLAQGGLEVYEVPGGHISMLEEPNVQVLVEKLKNCIQRATI